VHLQETLLSMVVVLIKSVNICHLPVDNSGSIFAAQYCHMVPSHKMHLNRLLTALKHSMKYVNLDHVMATPVSIFRPFCLFHFHLYSFGRKFNIYLTFRNHASYILEGTPLPYKHPTLCIFSTNIRTEYFKHTA
jgi:hypothetical protein